MLFPKLNASFFSNLACPVDQLRPRIATLLTEEARFYTTPHDFFDRHAYFFLELAPLEYRRTSSDDQMLSYIPKIRDLFAAISNVDWSTSNLSKTLNELTNLASEVAVTEDNRVSAPFAKGSLLPYLRWAVTGGRPGPLLASTMSILGRDLTLHRFGKAALIFEALLQTDRDSASIHD